MSQLFSSVSSESVSSENERINEKDPSVIDIDLDINIDGLPETKETTSTEKVPGKLYKRNGKCTISMLCP